jgi:hypothetical protein
MVLGKIIAVYSHDYINQIVSIYKTYLPLFWALLTALKDHTTKEL